MREIPDCPLPFLALVRAHDGVEPSDEAAANPSMEAVSTYEILEADARKEENELNPQMVFALVHFASPSHTSLARPEPPKFRKAEILLWRNSWVRAGRPAGYN